jgi:signal peptide peptidase SppA
MASLFAGASSLVARCRKWWRGPPTVSVIRLAGVIGVDSAMRGGLTIRGLAPLLERAFAPSRLAAVALVINSPGGSPVQSALIAKRIRALADEKKVPVLAFVEDVAASGGYWLACAADEIYADENSIVGSIGVISASFGFQDLIARHGIERRVHTAGERKLMLDPFQPESPDDLERLKAIQVEIHESFKEMVRHRRGDRLGLDDEGREHILFSGEFWTGRRGMALGLVDGLGDLSSKLQERFGPKVRLRPVTESRGWLHLDLGGRTGLARGRAPVDWVATGIGGVLAALEERSWWARHGL